MDSQKDSEEKGFVPRMTRKIKQMIHKEKENVCKEKANVCKEKANVQTSFEHGKKQQAVNSF